MDRSPNLSLPYLAAAQAQKHVTHNEALRALDAVVQVGVLSRALAEPPVSPSDGERYLIAAGPTGDWEGHAGELAAFQDGAWAFYAPQSGWLVWISDEEVLVAWSGTAWVTAGSGGGGGGGGASAFTGLSDTPASYASQAGFVVLVNDAESALEFAEQIGRLGINADPDDTNKLAVASAASLLNHDGSGHQAKINKASASDTASLLFQTAFSGRAEFGTTGDDDWHVKVSADGSTWNEALVADRSTGRVSFPNTPLREVLTANRTIYVATTGNDSTGDGSIGNPYATLQKAENVARTLDFGGYIVTISLGDGTHTAGVAIGAKVGQAGPSYYRIKSTSGDASACIISTTSQDCFNVAADCQIENLELRTTTSGSGINAASPCVVNFGGIRFGATATFHMRLFGGSAAACISNYVITGNALIHWDISGCSFLNAGGRTVTLTGTPAFTIAFARAYLSGVGQINAMTFSGSATGSRYSISSGGCLYTNGGGATYLPGNSGGSGGTATGGGFYV